jgi:alpha-tubulin suppressor-like RCC1 family protein
MSFSPFRLLLIALVAFVFFPRLASATSPGRVVAWGNNAGGQATVPAAAMAGIVAIATGQAHSLALKDNSTVLAWGDNLYGQITVPTGLTGVIAIAGGEAHSLALKNTGTVVAWGGNFNGQTTVPLAALSGVSAIAAGGRHSVALLNNGTVVAWGSNAAGQTSVPAGLSGVTAIAAGDAHTVALKSDGSVVAWGGNFNGQTTVPAAAMSGVTAIAAGDHNTVALLNNGTLLAWGANNCGQANLPVSLSGVTAIAAGFFQTVALKNDGTLVTWGCNAWDLLAVPAAAQNCVLAISACYGHTLAIVSAPPLIVVPPASQLRLAGQTAIFSAAATGTPTLMYQWSHDGTPLINSGRISGATSPQLTISGLTTADAGDYTVEVTNCAATVTHPDPAILTILSSPPPGGVVTWGDNTFGQLPVPSAAGAGVLAVAAGQGHNLALKTNGSVLAWGWNTSGQSTVPATAASGVVAIAAGQGHSLALKSNGTVIAWGNNAEGQTNVPALLSNIVAISGGGSHSLALHHGGTISAWGSNGFGQCTIPPAVGTVIAITAGFYHSAAIRADGTVAAWGDNTHGQCNVPPGLADVVAISAGFYHTLALKADGTVVAWGAGTATATTPDLGQSIVPAGLGLALAPSAGRYHSVALLANQSASAWGDASAGQTTVPISSQGRFVAVAAGWMHNTAIVRIAPHDLFLDAAAYANLGRTLTISVISDGSGPLVYQWQKQSAMGYSNISGAKGAALVLSDVRASQAGNYRVIVSNELGTVTSTPVMVTTLPDTTFSEWSKTQFNADQLADPTISGPLATPAKDGVSNLLKYAFNLPVFGPNPMAPAPVGPAGLALAPTRTEEGALRLGFQAVRTDLTYTVEASADLAYWSAEGVLVDTNGTARTATYLPPDSRAAFFRIRVSFASAF